MEQLSPPTNTQYRDNACETNWFKTCVEKQMYACTFEYGYDTWSGFWCRMGAPAGCFTHGLFVDCGRTGN